MSVVFDKPNLLLVYKLLAVHMLHFNPYVAMVTQDDGKFLLAVDESNEHTLSVWDISKDSKAVKKADCKVCRG